ncbi:MAG: bifunctional hydroxymethylpyrimidine kinase/phosphomethylpyrimidine kinase [Candidatus Altiarchaeales archaeon]|nr:MAG: bifunctional hydroxymethylpyrimidine kinase/phosphomethylpyrimidine kinase [Candidatus Altiarchaeales archaeon]
MKTVLTIAGSDSGGGAGVQQDLKTFSAFKLHGASVITTITAQNTLGVQKIFVLPLDIIEAQIDSIITDLKPVAVKTGMLARSEVIELVYEKIRHYKTENLVVDPVMISTSGNRLLEESAIEGMKKLISIAKISTPNIREAEVLSGIKIETEEDMEKSARKIGNCVVTGGHLRATDILHYNGRIYRFESKGKARMEIHGTGCAFASAIAACLALGLEVPDAVKRTKEFMDSIIGRNFAVGSGLRVADTSGIKLGRAYETEEKRSIIEDIEMAVQRFISTEGSYRLVPEVGVNIAMALENAKKIEDVAGICGRLVRYKKGVVPVGTIEFGGTSHVGRIVLTAMKFDAKKRAAMNIRFSDEILNACKELGLKISSFDRERQPKDTKTMEWGISEAIKGLGEIPDVIYDEGGVGKEAMIRILGEDAISVIELALRIGKNM